MSIEVINPAARIDWNELILKADNYSFFHSSNWARTLHEAYGFDPLYFAFFEKGTLKALIPVMEVRSFLSGCRGVSLPFSDFCEFLGRGDSLRRVLERVLEHGKEAGWKYLELRGEHPLLDGKPSSRFHYVHDLDLTLGEEKLHRNMRDSTRRNIKKASKEDVRVVCDDSWESVVEFCRLNSITRRQHGIPPQPALFFERFHQNVMSRGLGRVYLARYRGSCIAGAIYVRFGDRVLYKYGASDGRFQHLRGNNLLMWEAIRAYSAEGAASFSFGRTEPENEGLRQFKNGWGAREDTVRYYRFNVPQNSFEADEGNHRAGYTRIFSRLPLPVLETIGKYLYRHVG